MVDIIDSKRRTTRKRIKILREKYPIYNIWTVGETGKYLEIKLKKGKLFGKLIMYVGRDWIELYKKEYMSLAKEIVDMFEQIQTIELSYTNDIN